MKLGKVLVPTDFSRCSEPAVEFAVEFARATGGSLTLLHVYDPPPYETPDGMPVFVHLNTDGVIAKFGKLLEDAKLRAAQAGVARVDTLLLRGAAHAEIVGAAEEGGYGLIVMGTHGRTGFAHMLLGSVAERVVRKAACPVITVPTLDRTQKP